MKHPMKHPIKTRSYYEVFLRAKITRWLDHDIFSLTTTEKVSMIEFFSITHISKERRITYQLIRVQVVFSPFGHCF